MCPWDTTWTISDVQMGSWAASRDISGRTVSNPHIHGDFQMATAPIGRNPVRLSPGGTTGFIPD